MHSIRRDPIGKSRMQTACIAVLAILSAAGLALVLPTTSPLTERANSAVFVVCAVGAYYILKRGLALAQTRRDRVYFLSFGFAMSFVYALGRYVYLYHTAQNIAMILLLACLLTPVIAALLAIVTRGFIDAAGRVDDANAARPSFFARKRLFPIVFFAMLLCGIPCFLAYYPANINYDIANQVQQIITGEFSTHHPLLHTLYIKLCLDAGLLLTGGYTGGFAIYAATQTLMMAAAFAYAFCCIVRLTPGKNAFHWVILGLFALYPSNHLLAVTTTKDVLAAGAMLVSLSALCLLLFDQQARAKDVRLTLALLVVCAALAMLLRNGVVYAYIALALVLLACGRRRLRLAVPILLSIVLFYSAAAVMKSALRASDGSPVEMLSIPIQQVVYANIQHPERFTQEEQALFDELIETNKRYLPHISDPIKSFIDPDVLTQNWKAYLDLYCSVGKKSPGVYVDAFLIMNLGAWYPDEITHADVHTDHQGYLHTSDWFYTYDKSLITVEKHSLLPAVERLYNLFAAENIHQKIPVVSMLFSPGFICQAMFVLFFVLLYRRQYASLLPFVPLIAYWLELLFAPCIYIRYIYPIMVCMPLLAALALRSEPPGLPARAKEASAGTGA